MTIIQSNQEFVVSGGQRDNSMTKGYYTRSNLLLETFCQE